MDGFRFWLRLLFWQDMREIYIRKSGSIYHLTRMLALSRQFFITPFVVCFCILGLGLLQFPCMQKLLKSNTTASSETLAKEINSEKLRLNFLKKVPSFGYDNLMANWMYLSFIQYFGDDEIRDKTGYGLSPEYFEVILKRDPRFISAYLSLSTSTSIYAGMPERSINLMEDGLKLLSPWVPKKSYYIWRYKGIDELLFSGNSSAAKQSFATSADWASKHSDEESKQVAFFSQKTTEFLDRNPSLRKAQIAGWTMVLNNGVDEKTRHRAISKIEALGGKVLVNPDGTMTIRG